MKHKKPVMIITALFATATLITIGLASRGTRRAWRTTAFRLSACTHNAAWERRVCDKSEWDCPEITKMPGPPRS